VSPQKKRQTQRRGKNTGKNSNADVANAAPQQSERDKFVAAVGGMIISFGHFEATLRGIITNITTGIFEDDDLTLRVSALVAGQRFSDLLARLSAQLRIAAPGRNDFQKRVSIWLSAADDACSQRNRFAHQPLVFRSKRPGDIEWAVYRIRASRRAGFVAHFDPIKIDEILRLRGVIRRLEDDLENIVDDMLAAKLLPSSVKYRLVAVDPTAPPPWKTP
jgi:hypothetical protein